MKNFKAIIAIILTMAIVLSQATLAQATDGNEFPADYVDNSNEGFDILSSLSEKEQSLFAAFDFFDTFQRSITPAFDLIALRY